MKNPEFLAFFCIQTLLDFDKAQMRSWNIAYPIEYILWIILSLSTSFQGSSLFQNRYHQVTHLDYVITAHAIGHDVIGHKKSKVYGSTFTELKPVLGYLFLF